MNKKKKIISIIILSCICIFIIIISFNILSNNKLSTDIELSFFIKMAENKTDCSDIRNELYLINDDIVFWIVEGSCSDASYSYTLYQDNTENILCQLFDSIAGPQEICNEEFQDLFRILTNNIDVKDFGIGKSYSITQFF